MQGVLAGSSQGRIEHALGGRGLGRPGGVFEQVLGGATSGTGTGGLLSGLVEMATSMLVGRCYAASLLAIEVDTPAERAYLRQLRPGPGTR